MAPRGKIQREHFNYYLDLMRQIEWDLHHEILAEKRIPEAWHRIARAKGVSEKERVTLRIEGDVLKFFRRMGTGYQQRMNDVLAAWMHGRIAGLIEGPDTEDICTQVAAFGRPRIGEGELAARGMAFGSDGKVVDLEGER
ncbi:MAG: BrnA antitoxin family protein [Sulfitobacter sp.]|nr:BrnA antitoxin family protein [Sulfitobacter sp.]